MTAVKKFLQGASGALGQIHFARFDTVPELHSYGVGETTGAMFSTTEVTVDASMGPLVTLALCHERRFGRGGDLALTPSQTLQRYTVWVVGGLGSECEPLNRVFPFGWEEGLDKKKQ